MQGGFTPPVPPGGPPAPPGGPPAFPGGGGQMMGQPPLPPGLTPEQEQAILEDKVGHVHHGLAV